MEHSGPSWIVMMYTEAALAPRQIKSFSDPQPMTVLEIQRYLKDTTRMTRASFFVEKVCTRASSPREAIVPNPDALTDKMSPSASSIKKPPKYRSSKYLFDVTISDGVFQKRCFLAPELSRLVHTNALRCGVLVKISEASCVYSHKISDYVACIERLEIVGEANGRDAARHHSLPEKIEKPPVPLTGRWEYYLPLWHNEDPYGDIWLEENSSEEFYVREISRKSLAYLEQRYADELCNKVQVAISPLIVRVIKKGKLQFYGIPSLPTEMPYKATFRVADHSGSMDMVVCDEFCLEWYNTFEVGTVLYLEEYGVKKTRRFEKKKARGTKKSFSIELVLDAKKTSLEMGILSEHEVKRKWRVPGVKYRFISRSRLPTTPYKDNCDVAGLVKFVGRTERMRQPEHGEDFWIYRWVLVVDETSDQAFVLQLFSSSQPDIFENIHPMAHLVCTNVKVIQKPALTGGTTTYLKTTNDSQMFISEWHRGQPYEEALRVQRVAYWMLKQEETSNQEEFFMGGYYPLPAPPTTLLKNSVPVPTADQDLKSISEIRKEIRKLHYRESKRFTMVGRIGIIKYVNCTKTAPDGSVSATDQVNQDAGEGSSTQTSTPPEPRRHSAKRKRSDEDDGDDASEGQSAKVLKKPGKRSAKKKHCTSAKQPSNYWESRLWAEIKDELSMHVDYSKIFRESFPCKFNFENAEFLMQMYNLQASKWKYVPTEDLQIEYACSLEYYKVTIVGKDYESAIDVALLPVCYAANLDLLKAAGMENPVEVLPDTSTSVHMQAACEETREMLNENLLICTLDVCCLGEDKFEVFLNKLYVAED